MNAAHGLPTILLGGGGHARVLADSLRSAGRDVLGFTAPQHHPDLAPGVRWLGDDSIIDEHEPAGVELVNGIGSIGPTEARQRIFDLWTEKAYRFADVHHPAAIVSTLDVRLGHGCQLLAASLIGPGVRLGDNVLLNSRVAVEHDCVVGDHCHIATGAILCGGCEVGVGVHVGAGATVIQGVTIGDGAIVAAGSVVTKDVEPSTLVAGVPGKKKTSAL